MANLKVKFNIPLGGTLNQLKSKIQQSYETVGDTIVTQTKKRFTTKEDPDGKPWKLLSPNTIAKNPKRNRQDILVDTGDLRFSIHHRIEGDKIYVGSVRTYAIYHQDGTPPYKIRPRTKKLLRFKTARGWVSKREVNHPGLAQRAFLGINQKDLEQIKDIIINAIQL